MKTTEVVVHIEGDEETANKAVHALASQFQVVQARVAGVPVPFEAMPNPAGSRFDPPAAPEPEPEAPAEPEAPKAKKGKK